MPYGSDAVVVHRPFAHARPERRAAVRSHARTAVLLAFTTLIAVQAVGLVAQHPSHDTDDAAFFYRYAENLAAGHGFRFNVGEAPVWGASAPLWPVLVALGLKAGLGPIEAAQAWSWVLALGATTLLGVVAHRLAGVLGVLALAPLVAANYLYATFATSGMESPLGYFVVGLALAAVVLPGRGVLLGIGAGLCLVHKIDLAPAGLAVLAGAVLWRRDAAGRALAVAGGIAAAWYGFAWWHFGSPIPNSLVSKYGATYGGMGSAWFAGRLLVGAGVIRCVLALAGAVAERRRPYPVAVALVGIAAPLAAYTWKPPAEPFQWYAAAVSPWLAILGALGLARLLRAIVPPVTPLRSTSAGLVLVGLAALLATLDAPLVKSRNGYMIGIEPVRVAAGRWVDAHAPPEARVLCAWGHVAWHSRRYVYDSTFLNRRPEAVSLVHEYRPEVLVVHGEGERPAPRPGYACLKRFPRPSHPERPLSFDVYVRADLFRAQVARLAEGGRVELPELSKPAAAALLRLVETAAPAPAQDAVRAEIEAWLAAVRRALATAPDGAVSETRLVGPWLDVLAERLGARAAG